MARTPTPEDIRPLLQLFQQGEMQALEPLAQAFSRRYPAHGLGWMLLGAIYKAAGRHQEALAAQLKAVAVMPPKAELFNNLGNIQFALHHLPDAEASYRKCLQLDPDHRNGLVNYGLLLSKAGRPQEAERLFRHALRLDPGAPEIGYRLAVALLDQKQYAPAAALLQDVLAERPDDSAAHDSLSFAFLSLGRFDAAVQQGRAAVQAAPDDPDVLANLLFTLNYGSGEAGERLELARSYGRLVSARASADRFTAWSVDPAPQKLRIGFVSGDFKNHPVAWFLLPLLESIDRDRFECFAYSTIDFDDDFTRRIRAAVDAFQVLPAESDLDAARRIHADGVHILVDLAGHTGHARLPVFALKPAPVQVSWLGYFATTGLPELDYVLVDPVAVPEAATAQFTEAAWSLPQTRLCFDAPRLAPEVAPPPLLQNGFVTFGSYQSVAKINDQVLACWAAVLGAMPTARLRWQSGQFADSEVRQRMADRLGQHGIAQSRFELLQSESRQDYLASHRNVDILLDTFPFPGGTTTCEALWMGVPTVTLAGGTLLSRQGASLLTATGLPDWIADSPADYVDKAVRFARDGTALAQLRQRLRPMAQASPLFDRAAFASNFGAAMQDIWRLHTAPQL